MDTRSRLSGDFKFSIQRGSTLEPLDVLLRQHIRGLQSQSHPSEEWELTIEGDLDGNEPHDDGKIMIKLNVRLGDGRAIQESYKYKWMRTGQLQKRIEGTSELQ